MSKALVKKFFEILADKKITQRKAAEMIGVSENTVSDWKVGEYLPRRNNLEAVRKFVKANGDTRKQKPQIGFCPICGKGLKRFNLKFTEDGNHVSWLQGECEDCKIPFTAGEAVPVKVEHPCEIAEWRRRLQEAERQLLLQETVYLRGGGVGVWHIGVRDGIYLADDLMMHPSASVVEIVNQYGYIEREEENEEDNTGR